MKNTIWYVAKPSNEEERRVKQKARMWFLNTYSMLLVLLFVLTVVVVLVDVPSMLRINIDGLLLMYIIASAIGFIAYMASLFAIKGQPVFSAIKNKSVASKIFAAIAGVVGYFLLTYVVFLLMGIALMIVLGLLSIIF